MQHQWQVPSSLELLIYSGWGVEVEYTLGIGTTLIQARLTRFHGKVAYAMQPISIPVFFFFLFLSKGSRMKHETYQILARSSGVSFHV